MKMRIHLTLLLFIATAGVSAGQTIEQSTNLSDSAAISVRQLASRDPLLRQSAAEELARLEASDHRRLIEGYRLQEKNSRVKLAMEWALYKFGKLESLFTVVRALDSSRDDQSTSYLKTLDDPTPLYFFLDQMNGNTQVKLLDILGKIGNAETLERIKPYLQSFDPKIVRHAQQAGAEIEQRLGPTPAETTTRPRRANAESVSP